MLNLSGPYHGPGDACVPVCMKHMHVTQPCLTMLFRITAWDGSSLPLTIFWAHACSAARSLLHPVSTSVVDADLCGGAREAKEGG